MLDKSKCPLCKRKYSDMLKHFVLTHDIKDMNHLAAEIGKVEEEEKIKIEFRNYVEDLLKKMKEGIISAKEYRELIVQWWREHRRSGIENGRDGENFY